LIDWGVDTLGTAVNLEMYGILLLGLCVAQSDRRVESRALPEIPFQISYFFIFLFSICIASSPPMYYILYYNRASIKMSHPA